ncbi:ABC transporter ATP-binding protein [Nitriliruptoraceae bacterium ZYF776]|nr:ABC transporter ATP-binding protein [Profundirhabdus halotolerans]
MGDAPVTDHLEVRGLTVRYAGADAPAVDGLSLRVGAGEVVAVLGPSGCGKSTLLRTVAGLEAPAEGAIHLAGRDLAGVRPDRRDVGLTFQDHALFPHRSVADNVAFGLRMRRREPEAVAARVAEVLGLVDLAALADRMPNELSGGEQQRVALARALAPSPSLLMLDEPLGALDRALRDRLLGDLVRVFGELDTTVLYVTHDHDEALTVADRVAVLHRGRLRQLAPPAELWRYPADTTVARFLGLDQLVAAEVHGGVATTRLGRLPAGQLDDGAAHALVLPEATRVLPDEGATVGDGEVAVHGTVRARRFAADRILVEVATDLGTDLRVTVPPTQPVEPGAPVAVAVELSQVRLVPDGGEADAGDRVQ